MKIFMGRMKNRNREGHYRIVMTFFENVKYLVVGLGEMEEADRKLAEELGVQQRIKFAGYRSNVKELLHAADCFVFPSLQEGLPVSLMEAMAAGIPVICSKIRGNTDLVTDGVEGMLVQAADADGYAKAVMMMKGASVLDITLE